MAKQSFLPGNKEDMKASILTVLLTLLLSVATLSAQSFTKAEQAHLQHAMGVLFPGSLPQTHITPLLGGFSDSGLYKLEVIDASQSKNIFVIRIMKNTKSENNQRLLESNLIASDLGIAPQIFYVSEDKSFLIMDFVSQETLSPNRFQENQTFETIISHLHKLHQGPKPSTPGQTLIALNRELLSKLNVQSSLKPELFAQIQNSLTNIEEAFNRNPQKALVHLDLHQDNILEKNGTMYFIDWETAAVDDPFTDLASLTLLMHFNEEQKEHLLALYFKEPVTSLHRAKLRLMERAIALKIGLWGYSQAITMGPEDTDFIKDLKDPSRLIQSTLPTGTKFFKVFYTEKKKLKTLQDFQLLGRVFLREFLLYINSKAFIEDLETLHL